MLNDPDGFVLLKLLIPPIFKTIAKLAFLGIGSERRMYNEVFPTKVHKVFAQVPT